MTEEVDGSIKRKFAKDEMSCPYVLSMIQIPAPDSRTIEVAPKAVNVRFPIGQVRFF